MQFGGPPKMLPTETGKDFWLKLSQTVPPIVDATVGDIYGCPRAGDGGIANPSYRGAKFNVNSAAFGDGDPVGADRPANHGANNGGCVLRKAGSVDVCGATEPLWLAAEQKTICGSVRRGPAANLAAGPRRRYHPLRDERPA